MPVLIVPRLRTLRTNVGFYAPSPLKVGPGYGVDLDRCKTGKRSAGRKRRDSGVDTTQKGTPRSARNTPRRTFSRSAMSDAWANATVGMSPRELDLFCDLRGFDPQEVHEHSVEMARRRQHRWWREGVDGLPRITRNSTPRATQQHRPVRPDSGKKLPRLHNAERAMNHVGPMGSAASHAAPTPGGSFPPPLSRSGRPRCSSVIQGSTGTPGHPHRIRGMSSMI